MVSVYRLPQGGIEMIYVLDSSGIARDPAKPSQRVLAWHDVFGAQALYIAEDDITVELTEDDVVYAHTPSDFDPLVPCDLLPEVTVLQRRTKKFRQMLTVASLAGKTPS